MSMAGTTNDWGYSKTARHPDAPGGPSLPPDRGIERPARQASHRCCCGQTERCPLDGTTDHRRRADPGLLAHHPSSLTRAARRCLIAAHLGRLRRCSAERGRATAPPWLRFAARLGPSCSLLVPSPFPAAGRGRESAARPRGGPGRRCGRRTDGERALRAAEPSKQTTINTRAAYRSPHWPTVRR